MPEYPMLLTSTDMKALVTEALTEFVNNYMQHKDTLLTIPQFCDLINISLTAFHNMVKKGYGPKVIELPGLRAPRIPYEEVQTFLQRVKEYNNSEAAALERARRHQQTVAAGKKAAASPKHVSRQKGKRRPK